MPIKKIRNKSIKFLYKNILKRYFFLFDPERVHDRMIETGHFLGNYKVTRWATDKMFYFGSYKLYQYIHGINFINPVGLSGGFDKNAELTQIIPSVGFGFEEIGSITAQPYEGNPGKRLHRLKKSKALIVNYGLKNDGAEKISEKLKNLKFEIPIGINIALTNKSIIQDTKSAVDDYIATFKIFDSKGIGDYFTINISCPNTYVGQPFVDVDNLDLLLKEVDNLNLKKPVFLKLSPDINKDKIDDILETVEKHNIQGFICTNLTKIRDNPNIMEKDLPETGGISGKVVQQLSNDLISYVYNKTKGKYTIIGVGGIFCAEDAYEKIKRGANLLQMITGMIFEGPEVISEINIGLVDLLKKDGFNNISEAVGIYHK